MSKITNDGLTVGVKGSDWVADTCKSVIIIYDIIPVKTLRWTSCEKNVINGSVSVNCFC